MTPGTSRKVLSCGCVVVFTAAEGGMQSVARDPRRQCRSLHTDFVPSGVWQAAFNRWRRSEAGG